MINPKIVCNFCLQISDRRYKHDSGGNFALSVEDHIKSKRDRVFFSSSRSRWGFKISRRKFLKFIFQEIFELHLPRNCFLLDDCIYPSRHPLLTPYTANQLNNQLRNIRRRRRKVNKVVRKYRVYVEHVITEYWVLSTDIADNDFLCLHRCVRICVLADTDYWRSPNYRRNSRFFCYFVTKAKKNTEKNIRRFKVNSSSIRQYTFCLEIQSIKRGNPAFFDPSFCCTFRSHRTILSEAVFLWA